MSLILDGTNGLSDVDGSASTPAIRGTDTNTGIFFPAADTIATSTGGAERMRVDSAGNVGIGTSSPASNLDVRGTTNGEDILQLSNSAGTSDGGTDNVLRVTCNGNTNWANLRVDAYTTVFRQNGTESMRIDSGGNLLVGTTSQYASAKLSVNGSIASGTGWYTRAGSSGALGSNLFNIQWTGSPFLWIDSTSIGQLATVSDYRLKENVTPQTGLALNRVMQLQPVEFNRKAVGIFGGSTAIEEGFVADQLQSIIPSAVYGDKDAVTEDGKIQPQSLNWSPIVSVLTKAIQEQQAIITDLKARIETLEAK